jgi:hypothetical protein
MYYALGPKENLETIYALITPHLEQGGELNAATARAAYQRFLAERQPEVPYEGGPRAEIVTDQSDIDALSRLFGLDDTPPGKRSGFEGVRDPEDPLPGWKRSLLDAGLEECRELEPALGALLDLVVDSVFTTANSLAAGSMTTGKALGVVWMDPLKGWSSFDCTEGLVHEMTHTLLMLDELRFGHYSDWSALKREQNFAKSAIRAEARPLNAVVHSYVVAGELLTLRSRYAPPQFIPRLHAGTAELKRKTLQARDSIYSMGNLAELITPRLEEILKRVDALVDKADMPETTSVTGEA